jgi:hypothetical protein
MRLKQPMPFFKQWLARERKGQWHFFSMAKLEQRTSSMTKSLEVITETIRNPKHPFRKVDNQPKKPLKHRYERRKIKEYLHLGDWITGEAT